MAKVLIYGAGAIGSFMGYLLSDKANCGDVALLGRRGHIERIREFGLRINMPEGPRNIRLQYAFSSLKEVERSGFCPDLVIVCVKTYSLHEVRGEILNSGSLEGCLKDSDFLLLMNGLGNGEALGLPPDRLYQGFTSIGIQFFKDGIIDLKGIGPTFIEKRVPERFSGFLRERFEEKGFVIELSSDFKHLQWSKLMVNAVANPISAITRKKNEATLSSELEATVERVIDECLQVAALEGVALDRIICQDFVRSIISKNAANTTSMYQDVIKGKRTEIDSFNGYVVEQAKKHGLSVPVNEMLYAIIKIIEMRSPSGRQIW
ncbi:MAG: 2-dehydropantoate 2-reductase [Methanosaeta sp. PtaU1.Bin112]|nr:MAG: 2-dehydropantoate 2-reductase [Methanosaeta sp. PtaU1.Bin112]